MKRPGLIRRSVGLLVGAAPHRVAGHPRPRPVRSHHAEPDHGWRPAPLRSGRGHHPGRARRMGEGTGIAMPNGTPCGLEDGVPQICWAPHNGRLRGLARPAHRIQAVHRAAAGAADPDHGARARASGAGRPPRPDSRTRCGSVALLVADMKTAGGYSPPAVALNARTLLPGPPPPSRRRSPSARRRTWRAAPARWARSRSGWC